MPHIHGGGNLIGPNLGRLFERSTGTKEGFDYSAAFKEAGLDWAINRLAEWAELVEGRN